MKPLILASSSNYRKTQLQTLGVPFSCVSPNINESAQPNETASHLAQRLAAEKARAVAHAFPNALIIGSDQTLAFEQKILGKPGTYEAAFQQLKMLHGKTVVLHSALALFNTANQQLQQTIVPTTVRYRTLTDEQIAHYLEKDNPFDCAGSCKCESLGIALLESVQSDDPSALIGLPLIALTTMLNNAELSPLQARS
ncbi:MAG TPA: Maf family nucleotide pyrophosphatase [Pseudomonadales bacterium]|nr:Maf family nucleotide pyrophosphatase [Pseudomonadales bacterium]